MRNKPKLYRLCQPFRLLLCDYELAVFGIFLDTKRGVPNPEHVRRNASHDEVVQVVVQRCASLFQPRVRLHFHFVSVALGQSNHRASVAHIFNQLVRCLAQVQNLSWKEYAHYLLEVSC